MDFLKQLASVEEVANELENVEKEESTLERFILFNLTGSQEYYDISTETETAKACAVEYNRIAADLRSLGHSVNGVTNEIDEISNEMAACSGDAVRASERIKHYNTLKVNAEKSLELVTAMIDLNRSVAGIENSLEHEEYEKATDYILKYRRAILTGDINAKDDTIMKKSTETLIRALTEQFQSSIAKNKQTQVYRYCHLLDSLGEGRSVLQPLVQYLMTPLIEQTRKDTSLLQTQRSSHQVGVVIGNLLGGLYQKAVELIDSVESSFSDCFVNERFAYGFLLRSVFVHCDTQAATLLSSYSNLRDLSVLFEDSKNRLQSYIVNEQGGEDTSLDALNPVLNEISLLLQHAESFSRYLIGKMNDAILEASQRVAPDHDLLAHYPSSAAVPSDVTTSLRNIEQKKGLPLGTQQPSWKASQSLCQSYTALEESYTLYAVNRSIFNAKLDEETHGSAIPEEVFYLFEIVVSRAISQGNVRNIAMVISIVKGCIDQYLHAYFLSVIRGRKAVNTSNITSTLSKEQIAMVFTMNDLATCIEYIHKLVTRVTQALLSVFLQIPNTIKKNLDEMERESLRLMSESYQLLVRRIKETVVTPLSQKMEKNITSMNYGIDNEVQAEQQADELIDKELMLIQHTLTPYTVLLSNDTVTVLINELALALSSRIEISLTKLKYSQQGVLALDKVIRAICNELISMGGSEIRTNFGKINRLIAILSCDDVSSAMSLITTDAKDLTNDQVKSVLKLRIDLSK